VRTEGSGISKIALSKETSVDMILTVVAMSVI
jgi:hypothetical protein